MTLALLPFVLTFTACAPDIRDTDSDGDLDVADSGDSDTDSDTDTDSDSDADTDTDTDTDADLGRVVSIPEGGTGTTYVQVDSSSESDFVYFDFASATEVTLADGWELAFQRYNVLTNGGTSGTGGVEVSKVDDVALEEVSSVPADGWISDDGETYALGDWYDYDESTHALSAHPRVYVLRNGAGETWKLQFVDYYDDAGNSGHPAFRWASL